MQTKLAETERDPSTASSTSAGVKHWCPFNPVDLGVPSRSRARTVTDGARPDLLIDPNAAAAYIGHRELESIYRVSSSAARFMILVEKDRQLCIINSEMLSITLPFDAHRCHTNTAIKHPVPDRVKPSFVIFDIRAL